MANSEGTVQGTVTFNESDSAQFRILWNIPNYVEVKTRVRAPNYIQMKEHVTIIPGKFLFNLKFFPNGDEDSDPHHSSIYVRNKGTSDVWISFEVSLLNKNFEEIHNKKSHRRRFVPPNTSWCFTNWFPVNPADDVCNDMILTQGCLQVILRGTVFMYNYVGEAPHLENGSLKDNVEFDVTFLNQSNEGSDALFSVHEEEFQVHKNVLSKRSSVFRELFKNQSDNIVVISDVSAEVFRHVLQFVYTDTVTAGMDAVLPEVLKAAHKYKLEYLVDICQNKMIKNISISNAIDYLRVADELADSQLKEKAFQFIAENRLEISNEDSWKEFKSVPGDLLVELLDRFMLQK